MSCTYFKYIFHIGAIVSVLVIFVNAMAQQVHAI